MDDQIGQLPATIANSNIKPILISQIVSQFETFTQTEAQSLLNTKGQNRNIRESEVRKYKNDMNNGDWDQNDRSQSPILIDKNGVLRGGQHRMEAFVKSDLKKISFPVVRGATEEEIQRQDANINRSVGDRVKMFYSSPTCVNISDSKITSLSRILCQVTVNKTPTPQAIANMAQQNIKAIKAIDALINKGGKMARNSILCAAFVYCYGTMSDSVWINSIQSVDSGANLARDSALLRLTNLVGSPATRRQEDFFLKALCALKLTHQNESGHLIASKKVLDLKNW